jgi:hypothetical protein
MPAASAASAAALSDRLRIATLEAQLAEARKPKTLRQHVSRWMDDIGAGFGWGIVYFSLLPAWWGGQTVGKKLFGLQVVELTGKPMTVMRCLKRYGGYAAGMATGGLGFAQLLWDANRQALQDKAAHTVVVDMRAPRQLQPPADPPACPARLTTPPDRVFAAACPVPGPRLDCRARCKPHKTNSSPASAPAPLAVS